MASCKSSQPDIEYIPAVHTSKYYTASFPNLDVSPLLQKFQQATYKIITTSYYNTYEFDQLNITLADLRTNKPADIAAHHISSEESTSGTSVLLELNDKKALLITCNHVVSSPDTIVAYYENKNLPVNTFIKSISIKKRQNNIIFTPDKLYDFDIIATNPQSDIALINAFLEEDRTFSHFTGDLEMGNSNLLKPGSFLYILGYPKGFSMITRGIASPTSNTTDRFFMTDALFNRGISGGMIIASKNNFESFQWVGMACSSSADIDNYLVPRIAPTKYEQKAEPYRDSVFVQEKTHISYGVTQAVSINQIKTFMLHHKTIINQQGFTFFVK